MSLFELFLIAVGLSMDAFAVAICEGLGMKKLDMHQALVIGLFFGGFQALMPFIGWMLGSQFAARIQSFDHWFLGAQFASLVTPIDHWIAFILLAFIGGKMLFDAIKGDDESETAKDGEGAPKDGEGAKGSAPRLDLRELTMLAIATSIDALAVGITFAFLDVDIVLAASFIGVVTFVLSVIGVAVGNQFGSRWEKPSAIVGGVVLILIGVRILLEHIGVVAL